MKKLLLIVFIFSFIYGLQAEEKILTLGVHPFHKSTNLKPEDLKKIAIDRAGDVKMGFEDAGHGELVYAFLEQIQKADVQTTEVQPGDKLNWMFFKEGKKVKVVKDAVWAGKKPFTAYQFTIFRDGFLYTFVVPLKCGNISMKGSETVPAPICGLTVTPMEVEQGKPFTVNACDSKNALKNVITIKDGSGVVVKTIELTPDACTAQVTLDNPGTYSVDNQAEGKYGMKSANPCKVEVRVTPPAAVVVVPPVGTAAGAAGGPGAAKKKIHFLGDIGFMQMKDPTNFIFLRAGIQHRLKDNIRLNALVGPFFNISGNDYGTPIVADLTISFHLSKFWLGAGAGAWLVKNDSKLDLIGDLGLELFTTTSFAGSLFIEGRTGVSDFGDNFGDMMRYGFGFRLVFPPQP